MDQKICIIFLVSVLTCLIQCRDFYMGMFKKNDRLVAHDRLYKEKVPFSRMHAKYLKKFNCNITYLRVADRLGGRGGPTVKIVRGGLLKNHIYLYIFSAYNQPLSVAIYIGCPKIQMTHVIEPSTETASNDTTMTEPDKQSDTTKDGDGDKIEGTTIEAGDSTTIDKPVDENEDTNPTTVES